MSSEPKTPENQDPASALESQPVDKAVDKPVDNSWLSEHARNSEAESASESTTSAHMGNFQGGKAGNRVTLLVRQENTVSSVKPAEKLTEESGTAFFEIRDPAINRGIGALTGTELAQFGAEWRAGALTIKQMGDMWHLARADVLKLGERYGARAVREEYRARLATGLLDPEAALGAASGHGQTTLPRDRSAAVDRAVARAVEVVARHKGEIGAARGIVVALLEELGAGSDQDPPLSLPQKATVADKLLSALSKAVALERQAYQIADDPGGNPAEHVPLEERLRRYAEAGGVGATWPAVEQAS